MPTDLPELSARKREAHTQTQTDIVTMVSVWVIIVLGTLVLVLVQLLSDQSFAKATIEWECLLKKPKSKNYQDGKDKEDD